MTIIILRDFLMVNYDCTLAEMGPEEIKEANRLMWAVKGMLIPDEYSREDVHRVLKGYLKRLWGNNEFYLHLESFEEVWNIHGKRKVSLYK